MTCFHISLFSSCEVNNNIANSFKKSTKLSKNVDNLPILLITLPLRPHSSIENGSNNTSERLLTTREVTPNTATPAKAPW